MKKKYTFIILATLILSMGMVSCEKAVETIFGGETGDDGLHRGYSVEMYEPVLQADQSYTFTAKFSDMERFRWNKMRLGFNVVERDYTPYDSPVGEPGEPSTTLWEFVEDTTQYKWVDEIADNGTYTFNFRPMANQQYSCYACVLEELSDGTLQIIYSTPFNIRGEAQIDIALVDSLGVEFEVTLNQDLIEKRIIETGICWSGKGVPLIQDNRTPYSSYSFNFGDWETVYLRGYVVYEDEAVDYSDVLEYQPQKWGFYVRTREDIARIKDTYHFENFRGTIIFEIDMLPEERAALAQTDCTIIGNGHGIYVGYVGTHGHIDNAAILGTKWSNHGMVTNCFIDNNNQVTNAPEGYIGQSSGWIWKNQGIIEDCHEITIAENYGLVKDCVNSFSNYYNENIPQIYVWLVHKNTEYGIIENCYQTNPSYKVCSYNDGIIR